MKLTEILLYPLFLLNKKVMETNWYKNVIPDLDNYPTNDWYRKHLERNYDFVVIGSSTGVYDFDLSVSDKKSFNWSTQPQAMEYSLRVLKSFFSIIRKNGTVIVVFSPFSGLSALGKQGKTTDDRFYHLLDRTLVYNYEEISKRRRYPLFCQPKESIKRLIKDVPKRKVRNCNICHTAEEYEADAKRWMEGWMREFGIVDINAPLNEENVQGRAKQAAVVQEIVDFCLERDLQLVFVLPPMHLALSSKLSPTFRQNYIYSFMEKFTAQGIPFYNYLDDLSFSADEYYANSYFMNETGAEAFTKSLLKEIGLST